MKHICLDSIRETAFTHEQRGKTRNTHVDAAVTRQLPLRLPFPLGPDDYRALTTRPLPSAWACSARPRGYPDPGVGVRTRAGVWQGEKAVRAMLVHRLRTHMADTSTWLVKHLHLHARTRCIGVVRYKKSRNRKLILQLSCVCRRARKSRACGISPELLPDEEALQPVAALPLQPLVAMNGVPLFLPAGDVCLVCLQGHRAVSEHVAKAPSRATAPVQDRRACRMLRVTQLGDQALGRGRWRRARAAPTQTPAQQR